MRAGGQPIVLKFLNEFDWWTSQDLLSRSFVKSARSSVRQTHLQVLKLSVSVHTLGTLVLGLLYYKVLAVRRPACTVERTNEKMDGRTGNVNQKNRC